MRLDKFLSHAVGLSRVHSRRIIKAKRVLVNDNLVTSSDYSLSTTDVISLDGTVIQLQGPRYFMLHKPTGYVCATTDSDHPTVLDLLTDKAEGLSIAGRLDIDTTGLVLLSDDGQWVHRVTSPRRDCMKTYHAKLDSEINDDTIEQFASGIVLRNETKPTKPASLRVIKDQCVEVSISEGKYHQVKRMFAACGHHVVALHRLQIGSVILDPQLALGEYRPLNDAEITEFMS